MAATQLETQCHFEADSDSAVPSQAWGRLLAAISECKSHGLVDGLSF